MFYCHVKYRNGYVHVFRMTKRDAWELLNRNDDVVQVTIYKNGRVFDEYIKTIHD